MGGGAWTSANFAAYSTSIGRDYDVKTGTLNASYTAQDLFTSRGLVKELNPYRVDRECCDSDEHPNTIPVILALDVTGSMGSAAAEVAKKLNTIMTSLYEEVTDVEFMVMGIGDFAYDGAPLQVSQFESDIRIAEQLDKVYFEGGGGGNGYESYTAAWYFASRHTKLDCWNRGKKGIIITFGDEPLNPYLPADRIKSVIGDGAEGNIETKALYDEVIEKFEVYHIAVDDNHTMYDHYAPKIKATWGKQLGERLIVSNLDNLAATVVDIVKNASGAPAAFVNAEPVDEIVTSENEIAW